MVTKVISLDNLGAEIERVMLENKRVTKQKTNTAIRATIIATWGAVIEETPVDEGRARGNWFITDGSPSSEIGSGDKGKGTAYVAQSIDNVFDNKIFLTNNLPYINKLEYGGYGQGDGSTDKTTADGFSALAPNGMVRINLLKFPRMLQESFAALKL